VTQITVGLSAEIIASLDSVAEQLNCSRAALVRRAVEDYLGNFEILSLTNAHDDPGDAVLDWNEVKRALRDKDKGSPFGGVQRGR
jgi:predicted transcriptional regulator